MYSGTTFRNHSGNVVGVHQRIDRVAKKHLTKHIGSDAFFPTIKTILHFEGKNGPDGIKSKSPSLDEPWHYITPGAVGDDPLITIISDHLHNLTAALKKKDEIRAGFEAAWLAHAIVDGLTPAHHFPLAEKIEELWGKPHTERQTKRDKVLIKASSRRDMVSKNWEYWGSKGVFSAHIFYEMGIASSISTVRFTDIGITETDLKEIAITGYIPYFMKSLDEIHAMGTFEEFGKSGWSVSLGNKIRRELIPLIMKNVCLAWYLAYVEAV